MSDIERLLTEIETHRANKTLVDDLTISSVLVEVEDRSHLERLFAAAPQRDMVVGRVDTFLRQEPATQSSDEELIAAAQGHLQEVRSLVDRRPSPDGAAALVDAFLALPCVVVAEADAGAGIPTLELRGVGEEVATLPAPTGSLTSDDVRNLVGIDAWTIHEMTFAHSDEVGEALEIVLGPLYDHAHVARFLIAPAFQDPFNFDHYHRLWAAGATMWISTERVEVRRGTAARWTFDNYGADPQLAAGGEDVVTDDDWAKTAGKSGTKAVALLKRSIDEGDALYAPRELGLASLPPSLATVESILRVALDSNRFTQIPPEIYKMPWLQVLNMNDNQLAVIDPELFAALPLLEIFNAKSNTFTTVPDEITTLAHLHRLDLSDGRLTALPDTVGDLKSLRRLFLDSTEMVTLPASIGQLHGLEMLSASKSKLRSLPPEILNLPDSTEVNFYGSELPDQLQSVYSMAAVREAWPQEWPQPS